MDDGFNGTYITFDGYVGLNKYRYLYFVIMLFAYILIIFTNSSIICLICIQKSLHEPMYVFIASLLVNSVLYSTAVYPKLLIDFLSDRQRISVPACLCQIFMYCTFVAAEFILLALMAYDRYVSICKPLQYPSIMTKRTVVIALALAWLFCGAQGLLVVLLTGNERLCNFTLKGIFCNPAIFRMKCVESNLINFYGIFALINFVFFPTLFILFTYTRILTITYRSSREVRMKAAQTCLPHLLVLISINIFVPFDVIIIRVESDLPKAARFIMTLQVFLYHPLSNPIIYGLKMTEISKHLRGWFCKCN